MRFLLDTAELNGKGDFFLDFPGLYARRSYYHGEKSITDIRVRAVRELSCGRWTKTDVHKNRGIEFTTRESVRCSEDLARLHGTLVQDFIIRNNNHTSFFQLH